MAGSDVSKDGAGDAAEGAAAETARLKRSLRGVIGISFPMGLVSLWPFYDGYWRFRDQFVEGNFVDATGQARYAESAVWGALALISFAIGLCAAWMLRRENSRRRHGHEPGSAPTPGSGD